MGKFLLPIVKHQKDIHCSLDRLWLTQEFDQFIKAEKKRNRLVFLATSMGKAMASDFG
jgi:hypothetical protein